MMRPARFRLLYNASCPPCRTLSRLAVAMSLGAIRRVALDAPETVALRARHPAWRSELLLIDDVTGRAWIGPAVFAAVPRAILAALWRWPASPPSHVS
jgi:predicted DCC family thiol-disulfide oxidoreductase YuxK